jgi:CheY-like chemotaxis protein
MPIIGNCTLAKIPASAGDDFADVPVERYRESGSIDGPVHTAPEDYFDSRTRDWPPVETRKTILICDDEPALRELVRASLSDGYRFAEASDGLLAIELAREVEPDIVILDLMLPRLGGLEVLAQLQTDEQLRHVPVLVITAWNETREDVLAAGAAEFVSKPFDPEELKAAIEGLLQGR